VHWPSPRRIKRGSHVSAPIASAVTKNGRCTPRGVVGRDPPIARVDPDSRRDVSPGGPDHPRQAGSLTWPSLFAFPLDGPTLRHFPRTHCRESGTSTGAPPASADAIAQIPGSV
jgi:hypothetical protein